MYRSNATIEDVYRLALPPTTRMLAGHAYLSRSVSWACSLRPSPPAFPKLEGNELALIDMEDLRQLDPKMNVERVVRGLADARIAAVAVQGEVEDQVIKAADSSQIALFTLPTNVPLSQIERAVIRLIVDRSGYIAQRSSDLQRELNQVALDGGGLTEIAEQVHRFSSAPAAILNEEGRIVAEAGFRASHASETLSLQTALPNIVELRSWAATRLHGQRTNTTGVLPLQDVGAAYLPYRQVVLAPVVVNEAVRGYCLLFRPTQTIDQEITAVEEIALMEAASASALAWAKQNAVDIAEDRMRATFLDELLASKIADEAAWIKRGSSLSYDLEIPHAAWFIEARGVATWPQPFIEFMSRMQVNAPYSRRNEGLLLFWPIDNTRSARELKEIAAGFAGQLSVNVPGAELTIGIGRPAVTPSQWIRSQTQAQESLRLGKDWRGAPVTYFGDLGLYQLLTSLGVNPESARFYRKTLGKLISHDDNRNSELVTTLDAFFACHGNLSQTSKRLHIHRNTLSYRLERIEAIADMDLNDPDARFSLQLALKLRPVMG